VTRAGQGLAFDRRKAYHYQHLAYNFRDKKAEPFLVTVEFDGQTSGKTAHAHDGQEFDYVLEGRMLIELGGNKVYLDAGIRCTTILRFPTPCTRWTPTPGLSPSSSNNPGGQAQ
jgi:hypothetical protein